MSSGTSPPASKCPSANESNIPVSKRFRSDTSKKSKTSNEFPELQKYIEIILKGNKEKYCEELSVSNRSVKSSNLIKLPSSEKCSPLKETENSFDDITNDELSLKSKSKNRRKTKLHDAARGCEEISENSIFSLKEKRQGNNAFKIKLGQTSEIEELLHNLDLKLHGFDKNTLSNDLSSGSKTDEYFSHKDTLQKYDEVKRDSYTSDHSLSDKFSILSQYTNGIEEGDSAIEFKRITESKNGSFHLHVEENFHKRINFKSKSSDESQNSQKKPAKWNTFKKLSDGMISLKKDLEDPNDYDLGKLRILNMNSMSETNEGDLGSERSKRSELNKNKKLTENKTLGEQCKAENLKNHKTSKIFKKIHKIEEANDLHPIYEIMNKTPEIGLGIAQRNENKTKDKEFKVRDEVNHNSFISDSDKFVQFLNQLNTSKNITQKNKGFMKSKNEDVERTVNENHVDAKDKNDISVSIRKRKEGERIQEISRKFESNGPHGGKTDHRKPESKKIPEDLKSVKDRLKRQAGWTIERKKESEGHSEKSKKTGNDYNPGKNIENLGYKSEEYGEACQRVDEVLQFMRDCIIKHRNDKKEREKEVNDTTEIDNSTEHCSTNLRITDEPSDQKIKALKRSRTHVRQGLINLPIPEVTSSSSCSSSKKKMKLKKNSNLRNFRFMRGRQSDSSQASSTNSFEVGERSTKFSAKKNRSKRIQKVVNHPAPRLNPPPTIEIQEIQDIQTYDVMPVFSDLANISVISETSSQNSLDDTSLAILELNTVSGNNVQTVECSNELGGYAEQHLEAMLMGFGDVRVPKTPCPLPVRTRKSNNNAYEILKTALENEEKLLAANFMKATEASSSYPACLTSKTSSSSKDFADYSPSSKSLVMKKPKPRKDNLYSLTEGLKQQSSNFVICVSSLPRKLRTVEGMKMSLASALSISFTDIRNTWTIPHLLQIPKFSLEQICIVPDVDRLACTYRVRTEIMTIMNKSVVAHVARVVYLPVTFEISKFKENSIENAQCPIVINNSGPLKKSLFVDVSPTSCGYNYESSKMTENLTENTESAVTLNFVLSSHSENNEEIEQNNLKEALSLEEALEETEENFLVLEQSNEPAESLFQACELLTCSSANETYVLRKSSSEHGWDTCTCAHDDKKKVCDLLLRTYDLQHKLYRYLHKMSCPQPSSLSLSCPFAHDEALLGLEALCRSDQEMNVRSNFETNKSGPQPIKRKPNSANDSLHYWNRDPPTTKKVKRIKLIDNFDVENEKAEKNLSLSQKNSESEKEKTPKGTRCEMKEFSSEGKKTTEEERLYKNDDDCSSTCSFKSSNDFSETNEMNDKKTGKAFNFSDNVDLKNKKFAKQRLDETGLFVEISKTKEKSGTPGENKIEKIISEPAENRLVGYLGESKIVSKVLKTVFKGRDSSTELSIGLKDIPMTTVDNISVEKEKFSANHTKISISISKDKSRERPESKRGEILSKINNDASAKCFLPYYLDRFRTSLSTSRTKCSKMEDDISKTSISSNINESDDDDVDDDDDDYKSVASSLSCHSNMEQKQSESVRDKNTELSKPKVFNEHRFDFYRKMNSDFSCDDEGRKKSEPIHAAVFRYKELEPLQKALTEMQIRMRNIKRNSYFGNNEYFERALKLAKMSTGYCQNCGNRTVIPKDSLGYYRNMLPRRHFSHSPKYCLRSINNPDSNFYSFRANHVDNSDRFYDFSLNQTSSYLLNKSSHSPGLLFRPSLKKFHYFWKNSSLNFK